MSHGTLRNEKNTRQATNDPDKKRGTDKRKTSTIVLVALFVCRRLSQGKSHDNQEKPSVFVFPTGWWMCSRVPLIICCLLVGGFEFRR